MILIWSHHLTRSIRRNKKSSNKLLRRIPTNQEWAWFRHNRHAPHFQICLMSNLEVILRYIIWSRKYISRNCWNKWRRRMLIRVLVLGLLLIRWLIVISFFFLRLMWLGKKIQTIHLQTKFLREAIIFRLIFPKNVRAKTVHVTR